MSLFGPIRIGPIGGRWALALLAAGAAIACAQQPGKPEVHPAVAATGQPRPALNLDSLFRVADVLGQAAGGAHPGLSAQLGRMPGFLPMGRAGVNFSAAGGLSDSGWARTAARNGFSDSAFNLQNPDGAHDHAGRLDFSAVAMVGSGRDGAFLGTSSSGGLSAGFGTGGHQYGFNSMAGMRPLRGMSGPPGIGGSDKQPTASLTLRLSF